MGVDKIALKLECKEQKHTNKQKLRRKEEERRNVYRCFWLTVSRRKEYSAVLNNAKSQEPEVPWS